MARIPASSNRSSKNVRNGPSPLQLRLTSLVREARWFVFAAVAAWLGLVLATWNAADPAWSQSVHSGVIRNRGGTFGANVSDFLLFLFGFSAWLWVVLLVQRVAVGFYRLTHLVLPNTKTEEPLPRVRWEIGIGFVLLLLGCMGFEALQLKTLGENQSLPAGAGGQLGFLLSHWLSTSLGFAGATLLFISFIAIGSSLFFNFSWLTVAEKIGQWVEKGVHRLLELKAAREDRRVGETKSAERKESVATKQEMFVHETPVRIEPSVTVVPKSERVQKEKQQSLFKEPKVVAGASS
ncbi:MAG TPA: DNA translocase FtsK 4TM domain-containing protein, partial [Paenalcaligenes sp.]|nr:DNA translocase FtsK 4TM domain-containing protein [Paenalcaligenes sp.]